MHTHTHTHTRGEIRVHVRVSVNVVRCVQVQSEWWSSIIRIKAADEEVHDNALIQKAKHVFARPCVCVCLISATGRGLRVDPDVCIPGEWSKRRWKGGGEKKWTSRKWGRAWKKFSPEVPRGETNGERGVKLNKSAARKLFCFAPNDEITQFRSHYYFISSSWIPLTQISRHVEITRKQNFLSFFLFCPSLLKIKTEKQKKKNI